MKTRRPHPLTRCSATPIVATAAKHGSYVLPSAVALLLLAHKWRPVAGWIWQLRNPVRDAIITGNLTVGWLLVLLSALMVEHFDLLNLRQD